MIKPVTRPSDSREVARSEVLRTPEVAALVDRYVPDGERVCHASDAMLHVLDFGRARSLKVLDGGLLQTDQALYFFPQDPFGQVKKPMRLALTEITEFGLLTDQEVKQARFAVDFTRRRHLVRWEIEFATGQQSADLWLEVIARTSRPASGGRMPVQRRNRLTGPLEALLRPGQGTKRD